MKLTVRKSKNSKIISQNTSLIQVEHGKISKLGKYEDIQINIGIHRPLKSDELQTLVRNWISIKNSRNNEQFEHT